MQKQRKENSAVFHRHQGFIYIHRHGRNSMPALRYIFKQTISRPRISLATARRFCAMVRKRMAFCKRPTTLRRSRRDNGLRLIRRSKMDLQEETAMPMGASKSSHHQRMAYQVFRKSRIPHYPQIRRPSTPTAKVLLCTINEKHLQSSRFADAFYCT